MYLLYTNGYPTDQPLSSELANASRYSGHTIYNPANSSTAKKVTGTWKIAYGDGSQAHGDVHTDTVALGDVVIPNQGLIVAQLYILF
jgi:aspartyl protease